MCTFRKCWSLKRQNIHLPQPREYCDFNCENRTYSAKLKPKLAKSRHQLLNNVVAILECDVATSELRDLNSSFTCDCMEIYTLGVAGSMVLISERPLADELKIVTCT